jgi:hypothetical protein
MWIFNKDYNKWVITEDQLTKSNFDYLKQELVSTRYYSKCLSGATYLPINTVDNIYDILGEYEPRNWYIDSSGSQYSYTAIPQNASPINGITSNNYYTKYLSEYGLTLKNLFTPDRLIKDSINYLYVDVATTEQINLSTRYTNLIIDGVKLLDGHRLLVKDQISIETLPFDTDPNTYFKGNYTLVQDYGTTIEYNYYNSENGIYLFNNGYLTKTDDLSLYEDCIRYSVSVKLGTINTQRQFHLSRLLSGYYPTSSLNEPVEFIEKHNWLLRNRVDYNNLFEINYYDVLKHDPQTYTINSITYSIPQRTIAVGEFGVILNTQQFTGLTGTSNIIPNKYKVNLRAIAQTEMHYWMCGDDGTLLKVRKHDFLLEKVNINIIKNLKSISFYNNLKGVVVGDLNTILITNDGGLNWDSIIVDDFESYYYNKVLFQSQDKIYIVGNTGVFIELEEDISGWTAYKRRISKFIDDYEEYLLVDNINDIIYSNVFWNLSSSNENTQSRDSGTTTTIKEFLLLVTNDGKIIANDLKSVTNFDFIYLEFNSIYGDITNIKQKGTSNYFLFSGDNGILRLDINKFTNIGVSNGVFNQYSNAIISSEEAFLYDDLLINKLFDYNSEELIVCGNTSLLRSATYSNPPLNFNLLDDNFESRLKSKMLFVDYDVASKLNFFTDAGEYRLPSSTSFNLVNSLDDITYSNNTSQDINQNNMSFLRSSIYVDNNSDKNPMDIEIKLNLTNPAGITNLLINLRAPNGKVINLKRASSGTGTTLSNVKFTTSFDYTRFRLSSAPYTNNTYQMDKILQLSNTFTLIPRANTNLLSALLNFDGGFRGNWELYIQWDQVNAGVFLPNTPYYNNTQGIGLGNLLIGKFFGWDLKFVYKQPNEIDLNCLLFTPLFYGPTAPSFMTQSETNWLTYWKDKQKTFKYYSDVPLDESTKVEISTKFCKSPTASARSILSITNSLSAISRLAPSLLDTTQSRFNGYGLTPISGPNELYDIYFYDYLMIVRVSTSFPVSVGDVLSLTSSVVDSQFIVNRIETITNFSHLNPILRSANRTSKYLYMYMDFNDNIITELMNSQNPIIITNLNKFQNINQLQERFNSHPISHGYQLTYNNPNNITIDAKFNNITSYYNLATQVIATGLNGNNSVTINNKMIYTDGFLKFGYTPTYNLLDYLEGLNDTTNLTTAKFTADKEYYAMPHYKALPSQGSGDETSTNVYFQYNGITFSNTNTKPSNILKFGFDLKLEWESIFVDTFVDIIMYSDNDYYNPPVGTTYSTERLLVMKKYYDSVEDKYIIEFGKSINFPTNGSANPKFIDILSRRTLLQISEDLQELNNIQRPRFNNRIIDNGNTTDHNYDNNFYNYDRTTNYKISTDSYTKILLSDVDTIKELSAIIYTDYKNELAMNITRLAREYSIKITDTDVYNDKLLIICGEKHELKNSDGVILEFNGGTFSSEVLNQQYFGYHIVNVVDEYKVWIDIPYINNTIVNDTGFLKYTKSDPFFNYQPIDIIDVGVNKKGKIAIELSIDNLKLTNDVYSLINVDYNKYRFRLIDGLNIETLSLQYPWMLEAEVSGALLGLDINGLVWYKGYWECGRWFGGTWISGTWKSGDWFAGTWNSKRITDNLISVEVDNSVSDTIQSTWFGGRWYDGTWNNGTWVDGRWYGGTWNNGNWYRGIWNDGTWNNGILSGGVWVDGTWNGGIFNCDNDPAYWLKGKWNGGDFENGIWYNGIFEEKNSLARFGTKAYNSRTANWKSGKWLSGSFYSRMITNNDGLPVVSTSHKYSIWKTGIWFTGDWYGGIAYNMDFQSGNWYGGILEDIQVIGITYNSDEDRYITLNGDFDFNIGDEINILNTFGLTNSIEGQYDVIECEPDSINKITKLYISIPDGYNTNNNDNETGLRIASRFRSANWKSGIWTNGIYETGLWEGGIWYNGLFKDGANWM